ncbi:MAG: cupin domain-containing protein [Clostridiales bacterium]|nr:cupin domain-containing protein [Clostridiales bacterium]
MNRRRYIEKDGCFSASDYGPEPLVFNIAAATSRNTNFRTAIWTGEHFQITLMCLNPGEDIGLEMHTDVDQFLRVSEGCGCAMLGSNKDKLYYQKNVNPNYAIVIPAGTWHNVINIGTKPLKLYSIYAPPEHPFGTVHKTKEIAELSEHHDH